MINGVHALLYTRAADDVRAFFRDMLGFSMVDAGQGWLIFALDVVAAVAELSATGVEFVGGVNDQGWGLVTGIKLPGGSTLGLYQPKHPTATTGSRN